ncbi:inositol monophosphatase family protein [Marivita hallyeonensis]|uniref:Inositol-1-monophosphatase n=1 Tax=Marivita hallyeonensis TaxID=996342 RepID=A0A1M5XYS4_9RHOB|nr:inositol monophosphatase family protein [Marivita hallyeonensis]SHI04866.1 myo-inositol-1(or 4)-monophosphatase [Marivita hallyeonensis]
MQGSANLNIMIKAARKVGRSLNKDFREVENLQSSAVNAAAFVARTVAATADLLREELTGVRRTYGYLDARGETEGEDPTRRWIVNALDGQTNFLHGQPHYAVTIALEHKRQIVSAVVFDPAKDEMFYSEKGQGAWLNDNKRVRVSNRDRLVDAVLAHGVPNGVKRTLPATLKDMARVMPECAGLRASGSAALDLAYVASGRFDGFWQREATVIDLAAGMLIASEAGALIEGIRSGQKPLEDGAILSANNQLFSALAKVIRTTD